MLPVALLDAAPLQPGRPQRPPHPRADGLAAFARPALATHLARPLLDPALPPRPARALRRASSAELELVQAQQTLISNLALVAFNTINHPWVVALRGYRLSPGW